MQQLKQFEVIPPEFDPRRDVFFRGKRLADLAAIYPQDMYPCLVVKNPLLPLPPVGRYGGWEIAEWEILRFLGRSGLLSPSSRVQ